MDSSAIGSIVRAERKAQGLRQQELAAASGVGVRFIVELEAGKPTLQMGKVLHVLSTLGYDLSVAREAVARPMSNALSIWWDGRIAGYLRLDGYGEMQFAYPDLSPKLAMKIAKKATLEEIQPRHWDQFADDVGISAPYLHRRIKQLCEAALDQVTVASTALNQALPQSVRFAGFATFDRGPSATPSARA